MAPDEDMTANDPAQVRSQKLVAHSQYDLIHGFEVFSIHVGSMKLPSLEKESPLCLPHGKLPDPTLRPVTVKQRVRVCLQARPQTGNAQF